MDEKEEVAIKHVESDEDDEPQEKIYLEDSHAKKDKWDCESVLSKKNEN